MQTQELIQKIENLRGSKLVAYVTGDREPFKTKIADAKQIEVIVPYRAHSTGTLIAIGADKIIMGRLGELSPVDPSTGHPFNPENPVNPKQSLK